MAPGGGCVWILKRFQTLQFLEKNIVRCSWKNICYFRNLNDFFNMFWWGWSNGKLGLFIYRYQIVALAGWSLKILQNIENEKAFDGLLKVPKKSGYVWTPRKYVVSISSLTAYNFIVYFTMAIYVVTIDGLQWLNTFVGSPAEVPYPACDSSCNDTQWCTSEIGTIVNPVLHKNCKGLTIYQVSCIQSVETIIELSLYVNYPGNFIEHLWAYGLALVTLSLVVLPDFFFFLQTIWIYIYKTFQYSFHIISCHLFAGGGTYFTEFDFMCYLSLSYQKSY